MKLLLQKWLEQPKYLSVEIVDSGGEKQQCTDLPAVLM
jgi:hypothetical protein